MNTVVPFIQEVSDTYTSQFLNTDELKLALWFRKVSGTFEKRAPGLEPGQLDHGGDERPNNEATAPSTYNKGPLQHNSCRVLF